MIYSKALLKREKRKEQQAKRSALLEQLKQQEQSISAAGRSPASDSKPAKTIR